MAKQPAPPQSASDPHSSPAVSRTQPVAGSGAALSLDGQLMAFRTAWLRMIARVWVEMGNSDDPSASALFRELEKDAKLAMCKALGFQWPWDTLTFKVHRPPHEENRLRWIGDDWVWSYIEDAEQLTIRVPLRPMYADREDARPSELQPLDNEAWRALALADYYAEYPSIFGRASGAGGATPRGASLVTSAVVDIAEQPLLSLADYFVTASPIRFGGKGQPAGGFVPSSASFLNLEVAIVSGLAKAWGNRRFADLLDAKKKDTALKASADVVAALSTIRGYRPEWRLELRLEDAAYDPDEPDKGFAFWVPPKDNGEPSKWVITTKHELRLNFPEKPQEISDASVALAAYNSTGAEYPFTCCA